MLRCCLHPRSCSYAGYLRVCFSAYAVLDKSENGAPSCCQFFADSLAQSNESNIGGNYWELSESISSSH